MSDSPIRLGFTGLGHRGASLVKRCLSMDDVTVSAICDVQERRLEVVDEQIQAADRPSPDRYADHHTMVEEAAIDGVVIATSWRYHIPFAIAAMEAGVWPGLDVGPASSLEECWQLVHTAEATGQHCMLLENGCFGRTCMGILSMARAGLFGRLVHGECGYCHDLRGRLNSISGTSRAETALELDGERYFRGVQHAKRNGDLYPTHGVGPIAQCFDINRGNRFTSLSSRASDPAGLADWAEHHLPADHPSQDIDWTHGDIVTTVITCASGQTLTVVHDVSLPRPNNSKRRILRGTRGMWQEELDAVYIDEMSPDHEWESLDTYLGEHEHTLWEAYQADGPRGGHGGSDYLVLRAFVQSIAQDVRPPIDVYDAAAWMAISPLSEASIEAGGDAVTFPDFTNGQWLVNEPHFGLMDEAGPQQLDFGTLLETA